MADATGLSLPPARRTDRRSQDAALGGNQANLRRLQAKLTVGAVDDPLEREADAAADRVMRMADPNISRAVPPTLSRKCAECEDEGGALQRKAVAADIAGEASPPIVDSVLTSPGRAIDPGTRDFMASRFGADFDHVRVHTDAQAAASAAAVGARAYTVGRDVVFGAGQYDPRGEAGRRLLAHELAHVIQQSSTSTRVLQREKPKTDAEAKVATQAAPPQPDPATATFHIVVRDSSLDLGGGTLVQDLADAKIKLMNRKVDKPWTLVLAIHASQDRLGAQAPPDWQKNAVFYDAAAVSALFGGDSAFVAWRDQYGPNQVVLYGCQVTAKFEQTIADNLVRGGKARTALGLGEGCKPLSNAATFLDDKNRQVTSRAQYNALSESVRNDILKLAQDVNKQWGYYGGPPVPDDQVLDYLFKGPKPGSWPRVEVIVKQGDDYVSTNPPIPYWNRLSSHEYLQHCTKAVGNLSERKPIAPE